VPGIGATLRLVILDEIQSIERFERAQEFCSYARLVNRERVLPLAELGANRRAFCSARPS